MTGRLSSFGLSLAGVAIVLAVVAAVLVARSGPESAEPAVSGISLVAERAVEPFPPESPLCRCPEEPLASYYDRADEVLLARLARAVDPIGDGDRLLAMVVVEIPWRTAPSRETPLATGETVAYRTGATTAECGVPVEVGAVYAVFAHAAEVPDSPLRVDTCSGTRVYVPGEGGQPRGFDDVPGDRVIAQLNAFSGLDVLRAFSASVPVLDDPDNETLVGLLDLPALSLGGRVPVRDRPTATAPVVAELESYDAIESREVGYEQPSAVVFASVEGGYRVRLREGDFGWIAPGDAGAWFPYEDLPVNRLAYLTEAWSGHVWPEPGAGIPARSSRRVTQERKEYAVEVHESAIIGGTIWFRVDLLSGSPCEAGDVRPELSGWVPGYGVEGQPVAWYHSRGC